MRLRHGHSRVVAGRQVLSPTYKSWRAMRQRCNDKNCVSYKRWYHEVSICKRWDSFENFLIDMGERPVGMTLDRRDGKKGYCKSNCRWATPKQQAATAAHPHRKIYNGRTVREWARYWDVSLDAARHRLWKKKIKGRTG